MYSILNWLHYLEPCCIRLEYRITSFQPKVPELSELYKAPVTLLVCMPSSRLLSCLAGKPEAFSSQLYTAIPSLTNVLSGLSDAVPGSLS